MSWVIIVLLTGVNPPIVDIMTKLRFDDKHVCQKYIYKNYARLNKQVNKDHKLHETTPNLFYCASLRR